MQRILFTSLLLLTGLFGQTQTSKFQSSKYNYSINIPADFKEKPAQGIHIDFKVADQFGSSITVNVSQRLPEEKGINAHDYSRDYFQTIFNQSSIKYVISQTEKIIIDKTKTFLIYYSYPANHGVNLKVIQAYLFVGNNAYLITATTDENHYNHYKNTFLQTIKSIKFQ
jgi:hypothetical protein